jgi:hypothetical protein
MWGYIVHSQTDAKWKLQGSLGSQEAACNLPPILEVKVRQNLGRKKIMCGKTVTNPM